MKKLALLVLLGFSLTSCYKEFIEPEEDKSDWLCKKEVRDLNFPDEEVFNVYVIEHKGHQLNQVNYFANETTVRSRHTCLSIDPTGYVFNDLGYLSLGGTVVSRLKDDTEVEF